MSFEHVLKEQVLTATPCKSSHKPCRSRVKVLVQRNSSSSRGTLRSLVQTLQECQGLKTADVWNLSVLCDEPKGWTDPCREDMNFHSPEISFSLLEVSLKINLKLTFFYLSLAVFPPSTKRKKLYFNAKISYLRNKLLQSST